MTHKTKSDEMSVVVIVHKGENLANRDVTLWRKSNKSDPYVVVNFSGIEHQKFQTEYIEDDPNPKWECNTFYVTSKDQLKKLEIKFTVMDYDPESNDDLVGKAAISNVYKKKKQFNVERSRIQELELYCNGKLAGKLFVQVFVFNGPIEAETRKKIAIKMIKDIFGNKISKKDIKRALRKKKEYNKKVKHTRMKMVKHYAKQIFGGLRYKIEFRELDLDEDDSCIVNIVTFISNAFCFLLTLADLPGVWKVAEKIGNRFLLSIKKKGFDGIKKAIRAYKEAKNSSIMKRAKKLWDVYQEVNEHIEYGEILKDIAQSWDTTDVIICGLTIASWFISGAAGFFIKCLLTLPDAVELTKCAVKTIKCCNCKKKNKKHQTKQYSSDSDTTSSSSSSDSDRDNNRDSDSSSSSCFDNNKYQNNKYQNYSDRKITKKKKYSSDSDSSSSSSSSSVTTSNNNYSHYKNKKKYDSDSDSSSDSSYNNFELSRVTIHIIRGIKLKDLDTGYRDKSDPFVKVTCVGLHREYTTRIVNNNLNPYWNQQFTFKDNNNFKKLKSIKFDVWDHDRYTKHDFIGSYTIYNPSEKKEYQQGYSQANYVKLKYKNKQDRGTLVFQLTFE